MTGCPAASFWSVVVSQALGSMPPSLAVSISEARIAQCWAPPSDPANSAFFLLCRGLHNRKNALFAGHDEGGRIWGRIASLVETAKLGGVEPYAYLKATLETLAEGHPQSRIDELLPWAFKSTT